ncbi:MAG: DUF4252 domain-containing protein [Bacteroidota bacterium]
MKKIILFLLAIVITSTAFAQSNAITKHFSEYQRNKEFTKVSVTSKMFSLFTEIDTDDPAEQDILEAMSKLKGIKALINDKIEGDGSDIYYNALEKISTDGTYEELMSVEDENENITFLIRDNGGVINELLMIAGGNTNFMLMSLYGEIDLSKIARISKKLKIKGLEQFQALDKEED